MIAVVINLHQGMPVTGNILEFQINHGYPCAIIVRGIFREKEASAQALH